MYLHFQELTLSKSILLALKKGLLRPKRKILMISYLILSRISRFCFQSLIPYSLPLSCKKGNPKDQLHSSLVQQGEVSRQSFFSLFIFGLFYTFVLNPCLCFVEKLDSGTLGINKKKSQESVFVFFYFFGKKFNLGVLGLQQYSWVQWRGVSKEDRLPFFFSFFCVELFCL